MIWPSDSMTINVPQRIEKVVYNVDSLENTEPYVGIYERDSNDKVIYNQKGETVIQIVGLEKVTLQLETAKSLDQQFEGMTFHPIPTFSLANETEKILSTPKCYVVCDNPASDFMAILNLITNENAGQIILQVPSHYQTTYESLVKSLITEGYGDKISIDLMQTEILSSKNLTENASEWRDCDGKTFLVTGSTGGIGKLLCRYLSDRGANLIRLSHSGRDETVVADLNDLKALQGIVTKSDKLHGIVHCAGVLDDGFAESQTEEKFSKVWKPKAAVETLLTLANEHSELEYFIVMSSVASVFGSPGQTNYAYANGYCTDVVLQHPKGRSYAFGPWSVGMTESLDTVDRLKKSGVYPIDIEDSDQVFDVMFHSDKKYCTVVKNDWKIYLESLKKVSPILKEFEGNVEFKDKDGFSKFSMMVIELNQKDAKVKVKRAIDEIVTECLGSEVKATEPLMAAGLDSLASVDLRNQLIQKFGMELSSTLLFDYPTVSDLTQHIMGQLFVNKDAKSENKENVTNASEAIAIVGMSCRLPGRSINYEKYWEMLMNRTFCMGRIKSDRFDIDAFYASDKDAPGKIYAPFICDMENPFDFDYKFFGISKSEAERIDPQGLQAIELSYLALCDAGIELEDVFGTMTDVYLGIEAKDDDEADLSKDKVNVYSATASSPSCSSGRISYLMGLKGAAVSIATACSASLVATHFGVNSLRLGQSNMVLAGGINVMTGPLMHLVFSRLHMLSVDGACKTFDHRANGYVRGEGGGMIVMERLSDAKANGRYVHALIRGSAVQQDGRSSTLTAPNGPSQENTIRTAIRNAGLEPKDIDFIECHGTGTSLGDPIEVNSIKGVFRDKKTPLYLGAVKSNIGHLETGAGIAGLIKVVLCLKNRHIPPNLHFEKLNQDINLDGTAIQLATDGVELPKDRVVRGGVSSFGFSGTLGHIIVESYDDIEPTDFSVIQSKINPVYCRNPHSIYLEKHAPSVLIRKDDIADHIVRDRIIMPGAGYIELLSNKCKNIKNFKIQIPLVLEENEDNVRTKIELDDQNIKIISNDETTHVVASVADKPDSNSLNTNIPTNIDYSSLSISSIDPKELYFQMKRSGVNLGPQFQTIQKLVHNDTECFAELKTTSKLKITTLLDGAFQSTSCLFGDIVEGTYVPYEIDAIDFYDNDFPTSMKSYSVIRNVDHLKCTITMDVVLYDDSKTFCTVNGLVFKKILSSAEHNTQNFVLNEKSLPTKATIEQPFHFDYTYVNKDMDGFYQNILSQKNTIFTSDHSSILFVDLNVRSGLMGLVKTLAKEFPDIVMKYLYAENNAQIEIEKNSMDDLYVVYESNVRKVGSIVETKDYSVCRKLDFGERGALNNLKIINVNRPLPISGEVEVKVYANALNFRDVLNTMGLYPGNPGPIGGEFAGIVSKVPKDEVDYKVGDVVFGIGMNGFAEYTLAKRDLIHRGNDKYSFETLASFPVVALTVEESFYHLTQIKAGQTILVHAGAGGVGLIATQYALNAGCKVWVTCSDKKRPFIDSRVSGIGNSRDAEAFNKEVSNVSFDVVLNSLSDNFIKYSFDKLKKGGVFIEIGKIGIWSHDEAKAYREDATYHTVAIDHKIREEPKYIKQLLANVMTRNLKPMNETVYDMDNAIEAFRFLQSGQNVGKVLLRTSHPKLSGHYIVTGGTGALGYHVAKYLISSGVERITLISRSGKIVPKEIAHKCSILNLDLSIEENIHKLLTQNSNITGIIHCAGTLRDGFFENQTIENYETVYSKAKMAEWLDEYSRHLALECFVVYSSLASLMGSPGQSNYSTANCAMDRIIEERNRLGLVGTSIQWSGWDSRDVGGMADERTLQGMLREGFVPITSDIGEGFLNSRIRSNGVWGCVPMLKNNKKSDNINVDISKFQTKEEIQNEIQRIIKTISNEEIGVDESMMDNGIDSLSAVELLNELKRSFCVKIESTILFNYSTINALVEYFYIQIQKHSKALESVESENITMPLKPTILENKNSVTVIHHGLGQIEFFDTVYDEDEDEDYSNCVITKNSVKIPDCLINQPHECVLFTSDFEKGDIDDTLYSIVDKNKDSYVRIRRNNKIKVLSNFTNLKNINEGLPMWMIHPVEGTVHIYKHLNYKDGPLYGIFSSNKRRNTKYDVAEYYELIKSKQPHGPYIVGGFSYGAQIAWGICRKLSETTDDKIKLILFDHDLEHIEREEFEEEVFMRFKNDFLNSEYDYLTTKELNSISNFDSKYLVKLANSKKNVNSEYNNKIEKSNVEVISFRVDRDNLKFDHTKLSEKCKFTEYRAKFKSTTHLMMMMDPIVRNFNFNGF